MSKKKTTAAASLEVLMETLASKEGMTRQKARRALVAIGAPAVASLAGVLKNSRMDQVRWEAAKALGDIADIRSIPVLVGALEDGNEDVAWLAAKGLEKFKMAAWPALLNELIKNGADSFLLRHGVHHVLLNQKEEGYNDLLAELKKALEINTAPELRLEAARVILKKMKSGTKTL
jgi:HEAT repeat protein